MSASQGSDGVSVELEHIADHVVRVPLPLPLPDLKVVNAYVILGARNVTLIDPGWADEPSETTLRAALGILGSGAEDVRRILVTHQHWDHYSLGVKWRDQYGIELMLGRDERHSIEAFDPADGVHPRQLPMLRAAGASRLAAQIAELDWEPYERGIAFTYPDRWLKDAEEIDCDGVRIVARATPGHTRGHVVFDDVEHAMIFTGDHLLPRITPSIAFERAPEDLPLRSYLSSLELVLALPDSRMLPAHGRADLATHGRAEELVHHHDDRLKEIGDLVATGAATAFEVASQMVWTRRERSLDELDIVHRMTAILEVQSHLRLLEARAAISGHDDDGVRLFAVA